MKPKLPKGYRFLKVGEKAPRGTKYWSYDEGEFRPSGLVGKTCEKGWSDRKSDPYKLIGPYIAPKRTAKRRKKK